MKKRYLLCVLTLTVTLAMAGCSSNSTSTSEETNTEQTAENGGNGEDRGEMQNGKRGTITEISDTQLVMEAMSGGGGRGGQGGEAPGDGEAPEDGEKPEGTPPGDGEAPADGETPEGTPPGDQEMSADSETTVEDGETTENSSTNTSDGEAPEDGEAPSGDMPQMETETLTLTITENTEFYDEEGNEITIDDFAAGDMVVVETDDDNNALKITKSSGMGGQGGKNGAGGAGGNTASAPSSYQAVTTYSEDTSVSDETYTSEGEDENAILVDNGAAVDLDNITVTRKSSTSTGGDNSSFYGVGAAILTTEGITNISNATIETEAAGGAGVFAYGDGVVNISDSTITSTQDTSGGIHAAGGGTLNASNLTVTTSGESSAAIRSDRGGGTMNVTGGTYTSNGSGSPAVYCTADITVKDATLTATDSEAICIEGLNSLTLENCNLTGNIPADERNDCNWTVILYQSMSGDSQVGNSTFSMTGGSLTSQNGGMFYTTNTESTFYLSGVDLTYSDSNDFLLKCTGNSNQRGWGQSGANGADCTFTAEDQIMEGNVIWDSVSHLTMELGSGSTLTGAFIQDESNAGDGGDGTATLTVAQGATWTVTGDSTLTTLTNLGTIQDGEGNTVSVVGSDGTTYVEGTSACTITVDNYEG